MLEVQRLGADDMAEAAEVAARAFECDPFFRYCLPGSDRRYLRKLPGVFRMLFGVSLQRGGPLFGVRSKSNLVGAVALESPGRPLSWGDFMRSPVLLRPLVELALTGGPRALARLDRWDRGVRTLRPPEPHFYVLGLGVLPEFQGKGYGRPLMIPKPLAAPAAREGTLTASFPYLPVRRTFHSRAPFVGITS